MAKTSRNSELRSSWKQAFGIFFHPGVLIPIIVTGVFIILVNINNKNTTLVLLLTGLSSLSAGLAGGFAVERYREVSGNNLLVKKGRSAVRNLVLISAQLQRISTRITDKRKGHKIELSEVAHHLLTTEDNINAGIEDWIDLVPELKETSEINKRILEASFKVRELTKEKDALSKKLESKSQDKKKQESEIREKGEEITKLRQEIDKLQSKRLTISGPTLSGNLGPVGPTGPTSINSVIDSGVWGANFNNSSISESLRKLLGNNNGDIYGGLDTKKEDNSNPRAS
jgi:hypothetical protein